MKSSLLLYSTIVGAVVIAQATAAEEAAAIHWTEWLLPLTIIAILIALNGLYVASEFAIIGTRPSQMEEMAKDGNKTAAGVLKTLEDPRAQDRYIATAQLGITIASLGLGMYAEPALEHLIEPFIRAVFDLDAWALRFGSTPEDMLHLIGYVLVLSLITYLHVVVGEMVPKSIALSKAARAVLALSPVMRVSQLVLNPLVSLLNSIGTLLLRLLNLPPAKPRVHSPEEIEQIVSESAEGGFINEEEREIIQNIFDFGDRTVGQVMTPRRKVQALPANIPLDELMNVVANSTHNRFPVYEGDRDHVTGILHMQNLIKQQLNSKNGEFDLNLNGEILELKALFERIEQKTSQIDSTLNRTAEAFETKSVDLLERLEKKIRRAEKRKHAEAMNQLENLKNLLFPGGGLQERKVNITQFLEQRPDLIEVLIAAFDPLDYRFNLVEI